MNIYPYVKLIEWYPYTDEMSSFVRLYVEFSKCIKCGRGGIKFSRAYGHHSIPWGYGDVWCTWKCIRKD